MKILILGFWFSLFFSNTLIFSYFKSDINALKIKQRYQGYPRFSYILIAFPANTGGSLYFQNETFQVYSITASSCFSPAFHKAQLQANNLSQVEPWLNPSLFYSVFFLFVTTLTQPKLTLFEFDKNITFFLKIQEFCRKSAKFMKNSILLFRKRTSQTLSDHHDKIE